ncbi:MAG TPA: class I SAM-dependent methyltransferase, partial [Verrucomicrobiae bacterium]|nr:class I SAM-dependent methyltransferase [Verrucomicrobiae bacterium]
NGSAEATTLPSSSVDFITVGQAFHWFKPEPSRREFARILRPAGWVAIMWNDRTLSRTGFAVSYEELLVRFGTDYSRVRDAYPQKKDIREFFGHEQFLTHELPNFQHFDLESLRGRLRSSSYVPTEGNPNFAPMMAALDALFAAHQQNGRVVMEFSTWVHLGQLTAGGSRS